MLKCLNPMSLHIKLKAVPMSNWVEICRWSAVFPWVCMPAGFTWIDQCKHKSTRGKNPLNNHVILKSWGWSGTGPILLENNRIISNNFKFVGVKWKWKYNVNDFVFLFCFCISSGLIWIGVDEWGEFSNDLSSIARKSKVKLLFW